jgi:uncharacterized damage-inducible protein DinB
MTSAGTQAKTVAELSFDELLRHNQEETKRWHEFFRQHPDALDMTVDMAQSEDVRGMLVHIMAVEMLYAERIQGIVRKKLSLTDFPSGNVEELFSTGVKAREMFRDLLTRYTDAEWNEVITFGTKTSGGLTGSRRKMFAHALFHSMRHWAQLATTLRQNGLKQDWQHDFIFTKVME